MDDTNRGSVVRADSSPKMQVLQVVVYAGDVRDGVEHFEPYGFTSCPADAPSDGRGAEAIVVDLGGCSDHPVAIVVGDRRYRVTGLAKGEVCIHDDQGQRIHLKRDGIEIQAKKVTVTSDGEVTVNSDSVKLGNGADAALVRWPEFLSYMSGLSLPVTGACQVVVPPSPTPIVGTITGTATPPTPPPSTAMATTTVKAK